APPSPTATPRRIGTALPGLSPTPVAGTPTATPTPGQPTATPTPTRTPTVPAPIIFSGADSRLSSAYHLAAGRWRFEVSYSGTIQLDAYVLRGSSNQGYFAQCQGACSTGATLTLTDGDYN